MPTKEYHIPGWMSLLAERIILARNYVTSSVLPELRPNIQTTHRDRHYCYVAKTLESMSKARTRGVALSNEGERMSCVRFSFVLPVA